MAPHSEFSVLDAIESLRAPRSLARWAPDDLVGLHVAADKRPGPHHAVRSDGEVVGKRRIDADETVFPHVAESGYDYMRCDEAIVSDHGMVPDVIPAPQNDVIAKTNK